MSRRDDENKSNLFSQRTELYDRELVLTTPTCSEYIIYINIRMTPIQTDASPVIMKRNDRLVLIKALIT